MPLTRAQTDTAVALHTHLQQWLEVTCQDTEMDVVLSALTFEVGRLLALCSLGQPEPVVEEYVAQFATILRDHMRAIRHDVIQ